MTAITFNLDKSLVDFIKNFAREEWITQKEVIEKSLEKIKKEKRIKEIEAESQAYMRDEDFQKECLWLANSWLEDFNNNLKRLENEAN